MVNDYSLYKKTGLVLGPILFLIAYNLPFELITPVADKIVAVALWMITWWITEAVSIFATALIPLTIIPFLGLMDIKEVSANYGSPIVFLFFGGFVMALALEKVGLHKRIALSIVNFTGTSPNRVILGFMIATGFLSMWVSNTSTTVVMLPIALSVINLLKSDSEFTKGEKNFAISLMLGIAFAANIGGIATIIGTPPNTVMVGFMEQQYGVQVSFVRWMLMGVPFSCFMILVTYFVLVKLIYPNRIGQFSASRDVIKEELKKLGTIRKAEMCVIIVFLITISLWVFRVLINKYIPLVKLTDTGISMLAAFTLFAFPLNLKKGSFILEWEDTRRLPWGILILFGGGLALASGLSHSGVINFVGDAFASNTTWSVFTVGVILIFIMLFMTELISNVALVAVFSPVVAGIATGIDVDVLRLLIPITMASSCAFMLPMATPPNAIVFASGQVKVHEMVKAGVLLNFISVLVLILFFMFVIPVFFAV